MPALAVDAHDPGIRIRRLEPAMPPRQIGIAMSVDRDLPPAISRLLELTADVAADLVASPTLLSPPGRRR